MNRSRPTAQDVLLASLNESPAGLTAWDLAELSGFTQSTVTARLSEMIRGQHIKIVGSKRDPGDLRPRSIYATQTQQVKTEVQSFQDLLKLTVKILEAVPAKKRGPLAKRVAEIVKASK